MLFFTLDYRQRKEGIMENEDRSIQNLLVLNILRVIITRNIKALDNITIERSPHNLVELVNVKLMYAQLDFYNNVINKNIKLV